MTTTIECEGAALPAREKSPVEVAASKLPDWALEGIFRKFDGAVGMSREEQLVYWATWAELEHRNIITWSDDCETIYFKGTPI